MQTKHLCVLIHIWTKGEDSAPLNRFKPSSKIFYWPFQGGTSCVNRLCFSVLCLLCLCTRLFIWFLWSPAGKGLTSLLSFVVSYCLLLSHLYPGSGVVLDCINSWSLHTYLFKTSSKLGFMCLSQGHKGVTLVRLKPAATPSCVKYSTTKPLRSWECVRRKYVLGRCSMLHSPWSVMQHGRVLKMLIFDLLTPPQGRAKGPGAKYLLPCCCIRDSL